MQPRNRIGDGGSLHLRQVANGASSANHALVVAHRYDVDAAKCPEHVVLQRRDLALLGWVTAQKDIGHPQCAERQCPAFLRPAIAKVRYLQASTTDVDEHAVVDRESIDRAAECEACLFVAVDDSDVQPCLAPQTADKLIAVGSLADSRGRQRDGAPRT